MKTKVVEYQLIDHGIEGSQYFQGCGVAFTHYSDCVTGCGDTYDEALQDALESMAMEGIDVEAFEAELTAAAKGGSDLTHLAGSLRRDSATEQFKKYNPEAYDPDTEEWDFDGCDLYYYVSIRYSLAVANVAQEVSNAG